MTKKISLEDLLSKNKNYSLEKYQEKEVENKEDIKLPRKKSKEEIERIDKIKDSIDFTDGQIISIYGESAQKDIASFSDEIIKQVRSRDTGEVGEAMTELLVKVKNTDMSEVKSDGFLDKIPFIKKAKNSIEKYAESYDNLSSQIDKISAKLLDARLSLLKDIGTFDKLYEKNLQYYRSLESYIDAGEMKIKEARELEIPELLKEAQKASSPMALQVVEDYRKAVDRFEKKIFDLKTSKTVSLQTAPQIKLIQNNDKLLIDKLTDTINNVIPLWKSQVVMALGLYKQGKILDVQQMVSDTSNDLIVKNSEKLYKQSTEIAKEAERSTIDVESLKKANDNLIKTIEESMEIHENARSTRLEAECELVKIEDDLRRAIEKTYRN